MSELAYDMNGDAIVLPAHAQYWRVLRFRSPGSRGAPEVVTTREGAPMILPIDVGFIEFKETVENVPGRYRLDPIDDKRKTISNAPAAYLTIGELPPRNGVGLVDGGATLDGPEAALRELARANVEMARVNADLSTATRAIVEREARAQGIPLHGAGLRNGALTYRPVGERGEPYPEWLRALRGSSGVYVIRDRATREVVYVGESSTGRLYATLTRHFQGWRRYKSFWRDQYAEGHDPGLTYPRGSAGGAVLVTAPADALDEEARLILRLRPRDNVIGQPALEEAPF
ncbi:MAG: hypothetical protein KC464_09015 [Myxococcales bacterium]|nr:hypothetical protein [Myxococcales bacterium]